MNQEISPVLITGAAGFIGSALAIKLIKEKILSYSVLKSWKPTKSNISDIIKIITN